MKIAKWKNIFQRITQVNNSYSVLATPCCNGTFIVLVFWTRYIWSCSLRKRKRSPVLTRFLTPNVNERSKYVPDMIYPNLLQRPTGNRQQPAESTLVKHSAQNIYLGPPKTVERSHIYPVLWRMAWKAIISSHRCLSFASCASVLSKERLSRACVFFVFLVLPY